MKHDTIYLIPRGSFGDKNNNLQYDGPEETAQKILKLYRWVGQLGKPRKFWALNLFEQGNQSRGNTRWIMIEGWSYQDDLFFEFCEYIAEELNLKLELGFPE